jgi:hypothetical protein
MLDCCAGGHTFRESTHSNMVEFQGKMHALQRGSKSESDPEIQMGNVRKLVRFLEINPDCANGQIQGLGAKQNATEQARNPS